MVSLRRSQTTIAPAFVSSSAGVLHPGSPVEQVLGLAYPLDGRIRKLGALREELPEQAVGVLVGAPRPGRVRVAEAGPEAVASVKRACSAISTPWSVFDGLCLAGLNAAISRE